MRINIEECDITESIFDFAAENTQTGNISLALYGDKADNWINGNGKIPFIQIEGKMQWNIPLKEASVYDLAKTFQLNIGNDLEIEFDEVQNWGSYRDDLQKQRNVFNKFLKHTIKEWEPKGKSINTYALMKYIKHTEVQLDFVFDAIWIRDSYSLEEFGFMFSVTQKEADSILRCAGYEKKKCNHYYYLQIQRKQKIVDCIEKTFSVMKVKGTELNVLSRIKRSGFRKIENIGESLAEYGRQKNYYNIPTTDWQEPAYHRREDRLDKVLSFFLVFGMLAFIVIIVGVFSYQIMVKNQNNSDSLYNFWGAIAGSMIAGLITIFTTYLIIQRSYKIDYHQERIAVLPFFEANIISNHFSTQADEDIPAVVRDIIENHIFHSTCLMEDAMLIEFKNVGSGPAFQVKVEGLTDFYEEPLFQSIVVDNRKYMICYSRNNVKFTIKFCDIYGNYYYQCFTAESNFRDDEGYFEFNTNPPEMVLRTKRIRYIQ